MDETTQKMVDTLRELLTDIENPDKRKAAYAALLQFEIEHEQTS